MIPAYRTWKWTGPRHARGRPERTLAQGLVLVLLAANPAQAQDRVAPDSLEIEAVTFSGATAWPSRFLATAVVTQPTRCTALPPLCWIGVGVDRQYLDPRVLPQDELRLRFFYAQQGYRETSVRADTIRDGEKMRVEFHIEEGQPIRVDSVGVNGIDSLPPAIARNLPLTPGDPLSLTLHEATRDTLTLRLHNRGYARALVLANYNVPKGSYSASVAYDVYPGARSRFGKIDVVGAVRVSDAVVRRMLTFQPGDLYTATALLESQRNLFAQDVFRHAEIQQVPGSDGDTLVDVRVQVNEGNLYRVRTGLGLSSAEYLNAEVRWTSRNFLGGARRLELRGAITNLFAGTLGGLPVFDPTDAFYGRLAGSASADFTQPWFFSSRNNFQAGVFLERQSFPEVFVRTSGGGYVSLGRSLRSGSFTAAYRPELTRLSTAGGDLIFCIGFTACGPDEVEALSHANWLAPLALSFVRDKSNNLFAPTRGYTLRFDGEIATSLTGSDFSYYRLSADLIDYHTILPGWIWALRLSPGYAYELTNGGRTGLGIHPQKRFYAGGANSVRGFAQYRLGPKVLTIDALNRLAAPVDSGGAGCTPRSINVGTCDARALADQQPGAFEPRPIGGAISLVGNAEVRFPIGGSTLRGAAFVDYGQVWETRSVVRARDIVWTPGLGVRYFSPIGPIRVDVGYYGGRGETRSVVTTTLCPVDAVDADCTLDPAVDYDRSMLRNTNILRALDTQVLWNPRRSFLDRLQFHFSIGQAF